MTITSVNLLGFFFWFKRDLNIGDHDLAHHKEPVNKQKYNWEDTVFTEIAMLINEATGYQKCSPPSKQIYVAWNKGSRLPPIKKMIYNDGCPDFNTFPVI